MPPHHLRRRSGNLAEAGYGIEESQLFFWRTGTGKTHLATGLAIAACRQKKKGPLYGGLRSCVKRNARRQEQERTESRTNGGRAMS